MLRLEMKYIHILQKFVALKRNESYHSPVTALCNSVGTASLLHHSLVSPLTVILQEASGDNDTDLSPGYSVKKMDKIRRSAKMIQEILESLLKFKSNTQCFDAVLSAKKIVNVLKSKKRNKDIFLQYNFSMFQLKGSTFLFEEVLRCLITNALESYDDSINSSAVAFVYLARSDKFLHVTVADFGKGMNFVEKLIAPVKGITFKENGSGLGLFTVKFIVTRLFAGNFYIYSHPNIGTTIRCSFPCD